MKRIILGGVPEQVNIPILLAIENGYFTEFGLDVQYKLVPEGTGKMLDLLETGELDVALTVTDGFIAGRAKGRKVELLGTYVSSPLIWAVAGSVTSPILSLDNLRNCTSNIRVGISRLGSGSHTMAQYMSSQLLGIPVEKLSFVVANNFDGLCRGVTEGLFDIFMWETFTTQPSFANRTLHKV